jgi:NADH:ubiquinone oxidoreductase subunit 5 (subunit L)/multisubunit Na+/H+ antiporter MnhA subunit
MLPPDVLGWLSASAALWPALAFALLGLHALLREVPGERGEPAVARLVNGALALSLLASLGSAGALAARGGAPLDAALGEWFRAGGYAFELGVRVDALSATLSALSSLVVLLVGRFSVNYLHRERGFTRFFLLLALFAAGMQVLVLADSIDLLFVGWELVGLTSVLLVAFFHERAVPVRASLRVLATYRLCDVGLLGGAVLLHHAYGSARWADAFTPGAVAAVGAPAATAVGLALLAATLGKSAQLPVGGWLARAMEGPTPSSALFYGALSVHAGVYLLLRISPVLAHAPLVRGAVVAVGLMTALHAGLVGRVQADVKSQLAYATMAQVGLMFAEVGAGLHTLALVHLVAHALLRCHQLLRAPSALLEAQALRRAHAGRPLPQTGLEHLLPAPLQRRLWTLASARFGLDTLLERWLAEPVVRAGQALERLELRWLETLSGWTPRAPLPSLPCLDAAADAAAPVDAPPSSPPRGAAS